MDEVSAAQNGMFGLSMYSLRGVYIKKVYVRLVVEIVLKKSKLFETTLSVFFVLRVIKTITKSNSDTEKKNI